MEETRKLRDKAQKAQKFADDATAVATRQQFNDMAAAYDREADEREKMLAGRRPTTD